MPNSPSRPRPPSPPSPAPTRSPESRPAVGLRGLHVYRAALDYYRALVAATRGLPRGHVVDQALRAAESTVLNIAEAHPATGADRARRFRVAADEACEGVAALDLLEARGTLAAPTIDELRRRLDPVCAMLWRLSRPR